MRSTSLILALLVAALAPACKSKDGVTGVGFLDDYSQLKRSAEREGVYAWYRPGIDLRKYDYLMIDPIVVMGRQGSQTEKLSPELKQKATDGFRSVLFEKIGPYYSVVEKPGPNVLRIRIALTDLTPDEGEGEGSATLEAELLDAQSGERLVAVISTINGSGKGWRAEKKWLAVEGAFVEWAQRLLDYIDSFHEDAVIEGA